MSGGTIVHLGFGAFHRAHQAHYTQDAGGDWRIVAVSMRNPAAAEALNAQGGRFTLIEQHPDGAKAIEMTVVEEALALPTQPAEVIAAIAAPETAIVTLTVTEKAYTMDGARQLDLTDPGIAHDLAHPLQPQSPVGALVAGLDARRANGAGGITLLCCDNLPSNGQVLARLVQAFAQARDPDLAAWITRTCRFPDSMVDRITPAATDETRETATRLTGQPDALATETEPFRQWVIEDSFAGPRPAWEAAGVLFVTDVSPFETMKLRMLNGAHSMIAYLGVVAGLEAVRDVMAVAAYEALVRAHMQAAAETVGQLEGIDLDTYAEDLIGRFRNPAIRHLCAQIAMDGSQKLPQRLLAPARERLAAGRPIGTFALAVALWIRHLQGASETGQPVKVNDPLSARLREAASLADPVRAVLAVDGLASEGLEEHPGLCDAVAAHLDGLDRGCLTHISAIAETGWSATPEA